MTTLIGGPVPPQNSSNQTKRLGLIGLVVVVVAALVAASLFMVTRDNTTETAVSTYSDVPIDPPVFEPRGARGADPFFPVEDQVLDFRRTVEARSGQIMTAAEIEALDESVKTGLFGGTEENTCDPERLISFLYANPDLGEVWAGVHNIEFNEIAEYVRSLEIRILAESTNVINHGFDPATGGAYEIDTILDAGTAVLVDADGNIRTRCYCGNPIKPKPPQYRPPRCIVFGTLVFTMPGGTSRIDDVPSNVVLTGQQATGALGTWIEISWGTSDDQSGWTQSINLKKYHCAPPRDTGLCPGPGPVGVYAGPDTTTQIGGLNGTLNQVSGPLDIRGPISRVGGPDGVVVENGFVLIRFTQPAPSIQNSAWVQVLDLNATDCVPVAQCVNTEFAAKARAGGIDIRPAGVFKVEFTGHFTADRSVTEVRFLDGGEIGWITSFYTPLPWTDCEDDPDVKPVIKCVRDQRGTAPVWGSATSADPTEGVGTVKNTPVILVGDLTPTNGRVEIQMGPGGPIGWIDASELDGNTKYCVPTELCIAISGPAWSIFPSSGSQLPGTPGGERLVNYWSALAVDATTTPIGVSFLIDIDGQPGWIDLVNIVVPADRSCGQDPGDPDSPQECGDFAPGTTFLPEDACCIGSKVIGENGRSEGIEPPQFAEYVRTVNDRGNFIYEMRLLPEGRTVFASPENLASTDLCTGTPPTQIICPVINGQDSQVGGNFAIAGRCCADYLDTGPTIVNLEGTVDYGSSEDPLNFEYLTINNGWNPGEVFVAGSNCASANPDISCPELQNQQPTVGPATALQCCANLGNGDFAVVTLAGSIDFQDLDPFNWEYLTIEEGWIQSEDFWSSSNCVGSVAPQGLPVADDVPDEPLEPNVPEESDTVEPANPAPPAPPAPAPDQGCNTDRDGDRVCDDEDNCPRVSNPDQANTSGDMRGDACEPETGCTQNGGDSADRDGDGVCNQDDNCPSDPNPGQENSNETFPGDACESPCADKQTTDTGECCKEGTAAYKAECYQPCPDGRDLDIERNGCETKCPDGSVVPQGKDCPPECPQDRQNPSTGECCKEGTEHYHGGCYVICKDGNPDLGDGCGPCRARGGDRDGDTICDRDDNCPDLSTTKQTDTDGDGIGDACDKE